MKYASFDIETTGLDRMNCQILQVAVVIDDLKTSVDKLPKFTAFIGWDKLTFEPYALNLHIASGLLKKYFDTKDKRPFEKVMEELNAFMDLHYPIFGERDRRNFAGKNLASFDFPFIAANGSGGKAAGDFLRNIRHRIIDPAVFFTDFHHDESTASLDECKKRSGISSPVSHDALEDANDVVSVIRKIATFNCGRFIPTEDSSHT